MPLGYCAGCDTLRSIRPLGLKLGSRECDWGAIEHAEPSRHKGCGGVVYAIETEAGVIITCELCETALHEHEIDRGKPSCPGVGKVIR